MLLTIRSLTEGARLFIYLVYQWQDIEELSADPAERARAAEWVAFLVPIAKAFLTDMAMETTSLSVQVHGGAGFIRDTGVEQYLRDAKITCIYEGTNGIQALDLMGRKLAMNQGATVGPLLAELARVLDEPLPAAVAPLAARFRELLGEWAELTRLVLGRAAASADELGAAGADYLAFAGYTLLAWSWLKAAAAAARAQAAGGGDAEFYAAKVALADFYGARVLPRTLAHAAAVRAGAATLMAEAGMGGL
jgi:Acetyl-CoA dehydrogenase C-terminal like/Acyl-CoA dehydrogenase, C-terminal domain